MIHNTNAYVQTVIDGEGMAAQLFQSSRLVAQRPFKGKPEKGIKPGVTVTIQITKDTSGGYLDRNTGEILDNTMETMEVTIVNADYPLPLKKGDYLEISGFLPDISYFIDHNLILRYSHISKLTPTSKPGKDS